MIRLIWLFSFLSLTASCGGLEDQNEPHHENFEKRTVELNTLDSLESGKSYLPVHSRIESHPEYKTHYLTITANIRNVSTKDTVYITKAQYLDTYSKTIQSYIENPIYVAPMETIKIVIHNSNQEEHKGSNFIFDWRTRTNSIEPFFEGVMISTYGAQGLSITTEGKRIE
ncbi:DUF3124 domain-containing protein [Muriicola sp. E247]|uniref:DUF3124 domain-containing protein n=1 Tax=unclassified Muriicola TaxID=2647561 RepID=UPI003510983B